MGIHQGLPTGQQAAAAASGLGCNTEEHGGDGGGAEAQIRRVYGCSDHYTVLDIPRHATSAQVKKSYRSASRANAPRL
eukprot:COSAG02_NODE_5_length_66751_cov_63.939148_37_plen_78_part_00